MNTQPKPQTESSGEAVPMWLVGLFFVALYCGIVYVDANGGEFSAKVYAPIHNETELKAYEANAVDDTGKKVYLATCGQCHQATGLGAAGQFPPLAGSEWVNEPDPARFIRIALAGAQGPITVKGQQWNLVMSLNATTLNIKDEDLAAVLTYIRSEWGNSAPPVTVEQIKAVKEEAKDHVGTQWTEAELLKIPVKK